MAPSSLAKTTTTTLPSIQIHKKSRGWYYRPCSSENLVRIVDRELSSLHSSRQQSSRTVLERRSPGEAVESEGKRGVEYRVSMRPSTRKWS